MKAQTQAVLVSMGAINYNCAFNPLEKYVVAMEENKKLYERLLLAEREKNELLQSLVKK